MRKKPFNDGIFNLNYLHFKIEWVFNYMLRINGSVGNDDAIRDSLARTTKSLFNPEMAMETWWLSFTEQLDMTRWQFKGVIILDAHDFIDAHCRADFMRINPGGEIHGINITESGLSIKPQDRNRILAREEAMAYEIM